VSTDAFAVAVLPDPAMARGELVLAVDGPGSLYEVIGEKSRRDVLHCFRDWNELIERIARSGSVMIEPPGGLEPILLGPRRAECADEVWLTEVIRCLIPVLCDLTSCRQLVNAVLSRLAGGPVVIARRPGVPIRRDWSGRRVTSQRLQVDGRWVREFPMNAADMAGRGEDEGQSTTWSLVVPEGLPSSQALSLASHPLVAQLAGLLVSRQPDHLRQPVPQPLLGLIQAVLAADAMAFATAAAALAQANVTVVGSDGLVLASSAGQAAPQPDGAWQPAGEAREILLCDGTGLHGAIRICPDPLGSASEAPADLSRLLCNFGLALIRSIKSDRRQRNLENQLVMLSCLSGRSTEETSWRDRSAIPQAARRLVIVSASGAIDRSTGEPLLDAVVRAAEKNAVLSGLCVVTWQGSLIGLYPDSDPQLTRHRSAWSGVLHTLAAYGPLTVTVSTAVRDFGDFPGQHRLLGEIAKIQQSGSRYFNLPQVVMLDDLGPLADVIEATPGRGFAPFVERVLGDLLEDRRFGGQLIETLYAYLQTGGSPREAGALLHLHPSTVKYRIRVIRERLGPQLADRSSRLDIEFAVRLCLAAGPPGTGQD
jgi:PucR C-terminal helix-turn-helix domain